MQSLSEFLISYLFLLYSYFQDLTKACEYYEKAINEGSYRAAFDLIKAKMKLTNEEFDPIPILEQVRYKFYEKDRKAECVMQMGTYHFFVTKDYESALSYFSEFMEHYPNTKFLKVRLSRNKKWGGVYRLSFKLL